MLLTIGVTANILPYTYVSDEAVPSREEVFDVIFRSSFPRLGLSFEADGGVALSTRRKRR